MRTASGLALLSCEMQYQLCLRLPDASQHMTKRTLLASSKTECQLERRLGRRRQEARSSTCCLPLLLHPPSFRMLRVFTSHELFRGKKRSTMGSRAESSRAASSSASACWRTTRSKQATQMERTLGLCFLHQHVKSQARRGNLRPLSFSCEAQDGFAFLGRKKNLSCR